MSYPRSRCAYCLGTGTDRYQPCEGRYGITRGVLEALIERPVSLAIVTKNPMIVRSAGDRAV